MSPASRVWLVAADVSTAVVEKVGWWLRLGGDKDQLKKDARDELQVAGGTGSGEPDTPGAKSGSPGRVMQAYPCHSHG